MKRYLLVVPLWIALMGVVRAVPPDFEAHYDISRYGVTAGKMTVSLARKDGLLYYRSFSEPKGIFTLALKEQALDESTTLMEEKGVLLPIEYDRLQKNSSTNKDEHYRFDWKTNSVAVDYHGKQKSLAIPSGTMDLFSLQLKLMQDAASNASSFDYSVVSKGKLKTYTYSRLKAKKINTALGKLDTVRLERRKEDEDDTVFTLWVAPAQHYLPVRFVNTKNGDEVLTVEIASVIWHAEQEVDKTSQK